MSSKQEKILSILKSTFSKMVNEEAMSNTLKYLTQYKGTLSYLRTSKQIIQSLISTNVSSLTVIDVDKITKQKVPDVFGKMLTKMKIADKPDPKLNSSVWKASISKKHMKNQIQLILASIEDAETDSAFQSRTEAFLSYIYNHPEARVVSVKERAISILLKAKKKFKNKDQAALREALALLGYVNSVPGKGIRILSIDGGGIRGLLVLEMLKKLEELTGKRTYELFDFFCGTSTGAILAYSMGVHHKPLDEIADIYLAISREVFKQSPIWGTSNLVWSQSYYSTPLWEKKLKEYLGDMRLMETNRDPLCPKVCVVSAVVNQIHLSAYLFRNYSLPWKIQSQYLGSNQNRIWEAARASAAAPTYFEEFKLDEYIHQDGGILVNNPTAIAIHEAKLLWPNSPLQCVVSFGTGRTVPVYNRNDDIEADLSVNTSWRNKFFKILDSATDTEGVHTMLNDLLPYNVYYRFNPYLTEMISMVEINDEKINQLKRDALMYLRRNEDKFLDAATTLSEPKSYIQKSAEWLTYQRDLYGL